MNLDAHQTPLASRYALIAVGAVPALVLALKSRPGAERSHGAALEQTAG